MSIDRVLLWAILGAAGLTGLVVLAVLARESLRAASAALSRRRRERARRWLGSMRDVPSAALDELRTRFRPQDVEPVLEELAADGRWDPPALLRLYEAAGIVDLYLGELVSARQWKDRAQAALRLGKTGSARGVVPLVRVLNDPAEDASHVKPAAAQALAAIRDPAAIPDLLAALDAPDARVASAASGALAGFGAAVVEPLAARLDDVSPKPASLWTVRTLGLLGDPRAVYPLLGRLFDPDPEMRASVVEGLGRLGDRRAVFPLTDRMVRDPDAAVRAAAAGALSGLADEETLEPLLHALDDPDPATRERSVEALERMGPVAVEALRRTLRDGRREVRRRAAKALERLGAVFDAIQALGRPERSGRADAAATLEAIGRAGALDPLAKGIRQASDFRIRARLCEILGQVGDPAAVEALAEASGDSEWTVQAKALQALARIPMKDPPAKVWEALASPAEEVRWAAARIVAALPGGKAASHLELLNALARDPNRQIRLDSIRLLGKVGAAASAPILAAALQSDSIDIRQTACEALGALRTAEAFSALCGALNDPAPEVREAVVSALGGMGDPAGRDVLLGAVGAAAPRTVAGALWALSGGEATPVADRLMGDASPAARWVLIELLSVARDPRAGHFVRALLREPDHAMVRQAAVLCGDLRDAASAPMLLAMLSSPDAELRHAVVGALGRIGAPEALPALIRLLPQEDRQGKVPVLAAIGKLGGEPQKDIFMPYLSSDEIRVRAAAVLGLALAGGESAFASALAHFAEPEVQSAVLEMLTQEDEATAERFSRALHLPAGLPRKSGEGEEVGRRLASGYLQDLGESRDAGRRQRAAAAVGILKPREAVSALRGAIGGDPDEGVRAQALKALTDVAAPEEGVVALLDALADPSVRVRRASAGLLAKRGSSVGASAANARLVECLRSDEEDLVRDVSRALAEINRHNARPLVDLGLAQTDSRILSRLCAVLAGVDPAGMASLLSLLSRHETPEVRAAAARELARLPQDAVSSALEGALSDPSPVVRRAALDGLGAERAVLFRAQLERLGRDPVEDVRRAALRLLNREDP